MVPRSPVLERTATQPVRRAARPIDLVYLARQCMGDMGLEHEMLRLFDTTIKGYLVRLMADPSPEQIRFNLHTIKGAAAGVGAFTIADLAKAMEAEARAGGTVTSEQMNDLRIAIEEASVFVTDVLGKA